MTDYTRNIIFADKDALLNNDPLKVARGVEVDIELDSARAAINSKFDISDIASQIEAETGASDSVLITPLKLRQGVAQYNIDTLVYDGSDTATLVQAQEGTENTVVSTPLRVFDGITQFNIDNVVYSEDDRATMVEAQEMTSNVTLMTPLRTGQAIAQYNVDFPITQIPGDLEILGNLDVVDVKCTGFMVGGVWSGNGAPKPVAKFDALTQTQYDAIVTPDNNTIYFIRAD